MKRILFGTILILSLAFTNVFAVPMKFDVGARLYLGKYFGLQNGKVTDGLGGDGTLNKSLSAAPFGGGVNLDLIFLTEDKPYYGMGLGIYLGFTTMDQFLGTVYMTNGQSGNFASAGSSIINPNNPGTTLPQGSNIYLSQALTISQFEVALLYRFYPTRDFSIGVGPIINIILGRGNTEFLRSDFYTNSAQPDSENPNFNNYKYYVKPMFGDTVYLSFLVDAHITKFFGNFGVNFGVDLRLLFQPFTVGIGGTAGVKYRFDP